MVIGELLFYSSPQTPDLGDFLRYLKDTLGKFIDEIPETDFTKKSDEELLQQIIIARTVAPLKPDFDNARAEVQKTVFTVKDRYFDRSDIQVPGFLATKFVPFEGDPKLWRLRTNPYNTSPPHGEVKGQCLVIGIKVAESETNQAKSHIDSTIESIKEYLEFHKAQINEYNLTFPGLIPPLLQRRRERLGKAEDLLRSLQ